MKPGSIRLTHEGGSRSNGCRLDDAMHMHDGDIPESLDPRLEYVDRLLAIEAARQAAGAPAGLTQRVHEASVMALPRRMQPVVTQNALIEFRRGFTVSFARRLAMAACMGLVFLGGMWAARQSGPDPGKQFVQEDQSEGLAAFLTPIGDDEISDDRAGVSVIELGDAEFWAVERELSALESVLQLR
jgi:hypothetical protein